MSDDRDVGKGYPEEQPSGSGGGGEEKSGGGGPASDKAPDQESGSEGDSSQATGNRDAAG